MQLLGQSYPEIVLRGFGYPDLDLPPDPAFVCDLLLLSIASPERLGSLVHASIKAFAPRYIVLMTESLLTRPAVEALPSQVVGHIDKTASPDALVNSVRRVLQGYTCFPWPSGRDDGNKLDGLCIDVTHTINGFTLKPHMPSVSTMSWCCFQKGIP